MKEVKTGWKAMMAFAVVSVMVFVSYVPVGYAYSSAVDGTGTIACSYSAVSVCDSATQEDHTGSVVTESLAGTKASSSKFSYSGQVSKDLSLHITGEGTYYVKVTLVDPTEDIAYTFSFDGSSPIVLSNGTWEGTTSVTYTAESYVPFTISLVASNVSERYPTLGSVTFTLIREGSTTGSSDCITSNPISITGLIQSDSDVISALEEVNGSSISGTVGGKDDTFEFKASTSESANSAYITANSSTELVNKGTTFEFTLKIPATQKFCIQISMSRFVAANSNLEISSSNSNVSGTVSLSPSFISISSIYVYVTGSDDSGYTLTSGNSAVYNSYSDTLTLTFSGKRGTGILDDLKVQVIMQ